MTNRANDLPEIYTLPSGIRVIHQKTKSLAGHFGVVFGIGSRDENPQEHGLAHFTEHMLFKGTHKRSFKQIIDRIELVGGDLDAYTTKEFIVLSASLPNNYISRAVELFSDIIFKSRFPEQEILKERRVVIEEIKMYKDTPSEHIFDLYDELLFSNHPIGRNILGSEKSLRRFNDSSVKTFWERALDPSRIVICSAGKTTSNKIFDLVHTYFEKEYTPKTWIEREKPLAGEPFNVIKNKNTHQTHCIMGTRAYPSFHSKSIALRVLNNYLGGNSMNSRLNILLRERYGLVYQVESFYNGFSDTGAWGIYFGCDHQNTDQCQTLILDEISKLATHPFPSKKLTEIKRQLIGQVILDSENVQNIIFSKGKTLIMQNKIYTVGELIDMIQQVTPDDVLQVANELFSTDRLSTLILR